MKIFLVIAEVWLIYQYPFWNYTNFSLSISIMAAPLACRSALLVSSLSVRLRVCSSCARWFSSEPQGQEHADQRQTHFGFQSVSEEEKEHKGWWCQTTLFCVSFPSLSALRWVALRRRPFWGWGWGWRRLVEREYMFPCCDSILIRVIALALTSGQELFTLYSCSLRLRHLRGGGGGGGTVVTIWGLSPSQWRCQGKGHGLSLGGGHSSPSLFMEKKNCLR